MRVIIIFKLIFENPYPLIGGWLGDHALYALLKIYLNLCMIWVVEVWVIHLIFIVFSISITINFYFVYSYVFLYMYASTSNSINFDWYLYFHTYICVLIVLTISLYLWAQICHAKLDLVLNDNYSKLVSYTSLCIIFMSIT